MACSFRFKNLLQIMGLLHLDLNISLLYPLRIASVPRFQGGPLSDTGKTFLGVMSNSLKVY